MDQSCVRVQYDKRQITIWKESGTQNNPTFVHLSVWFERGAVMISDVMSISGVNDLYRAHEDEIIAPSQLTYGTAVEDEVVLMGDNIVLE